MRFLKQTAKVTLAVLLILGGIVCVAYIEYTERKLHKVPTRATGALHQTQVVHNGSVRLMVIGDMGWSGEPQKRVSTAMEIRCRAAKPDALIFLGDNIYKDGVDSVDDPAWEHHLMRFYRGKCLQDVPIYALLGNHDYIKNAQAQIDFTLKEPRWNMPFRYYDVAFGDILSFTAGDGWYPNYCLNGIGNCASNFLTTSLNHHQDKAWRLLGTHYPLRSVSAASSNHKGGVRGIVLEHFLCSQQVLPTAYVSGHAHHLEHSRSNKCNMDLLVSGAGGGSNLYPIVEDRPKSNLFAQSSYGFLEIAATAKRIRYTFFNDKAKTLYSTHQDKR